MKKFRIGWVLVSILVACGGTEAADPSLLPDEEGNSVIIEANENSAYAADSFSTENPNATTLGAGCWVVLDYCRDPKTGSATCHQNGKCSSNQYIKACIDLYKKLC